MSGHSHWATIKHKKQALDARKGALFSKLARALMVCAREGGDNPDFNISLQKLITEAKQSGMPMDKIENAIKKGAGKLEGQSIESKNYEGKGAGGVMIIVETLTDNSNRTSMEIRKLFERNNGSMLGPGAAMNQFERKGFIYIDAAGVSEDQLLEAVLEAGGDNCEKVGEAFEITTSFDSFLGVNKALESKKFKITSSETPFVPKYDNYVEISESDAKKVLRLLEELEEHDDVQKTHHNAKIPESLLK
jgi:YebC/PmpR family DNA-binding regulatory protein